MNFSFTSNLVSWPWPLWSLLWKSSFRLWFNLETLICFLKLFSSSEIVWRERRRCWRAVIHMTEEEISLHVIVWSRFFCDLNWISCVLEFWIRSAVNLLLYIYILVIDVSRLIIDQRNSVAQHNYVRYKRLLFMVITEYLWFVSVLIKHSDAQRNLWWRVVVYSIRGSDFIYDKH